MKSQHQDDFVRARLFDILSELRAQANLAPHYPLNQIDEYIDVGEYSIAYECIIANLEQIPFTLNGITAIKVLEAGLIMQYKTERPEDRAFDMRR